MEIPIQEYPQEPVAIGTLKEMSQKEVKLFKQDFAALLESIPNDEKGQAIKNILLRNEKVVFDTVRATMYKAKLPYQGRNTTGNGLGLDWVRSVDLGLTTWDVTISSTGETNWWDNTTTAGTAMTLNDKTGLVILGEVSDVADPKSDAMLWKKDGKEFGGHTLQWWFNKYGVLPESQPIIILPEGTILGKFNAIATGTERIVPIAIKVTTGDKLRAITSGALE